MGAVRVGGLPVGGAAVNGGLIIDGAIHLVPGVEILNGAHLSPGDCQPRTNHPNLWVNHKTIADDPEHVIEGVGPPGGAMRTAEYWAGDPRHSGAHGVTGHDGVAACLADLVRTTAYHAGNNGVNARSVGWETCELVGGGSYAAAFSATVEITLVGCRALGIQYQIPKLGSYNGHPLKRLEVGGGADLVGIIGHREVSEQRGKHDPGDLLFQMLAARGCEQFDFAAREDLDVWARRQEWLSMLGFYAGHHDGIPGPKTRAALKQAGFPDGIWRLAFTNEVVEDLGVPLELRR